MTTNNSTRRPLDTFLANLEEGQAPAQMTEEMKKVARHRLHILRHQRDLYIGDTARLEAEGDDPVVVDSFRVMAQDAARRMKNVQSILYPAPAAA